MEIARIFPISLLIFVMPILLYYFILSLKTNTFRHIRETRIVLLTVLSAAASFILNKIYYSISTANKNSFLEGKSFISFNDFPSKNALYAKGILSLCNADFENTGLFSVSTIQCVFNGILVFAALILIIYYIVEFIRNNQCDYICVILSIGFVLISFIYMFTNISVDMGSTRYLSYTAVVFPVLIIRFMESKINWFNKYTLIKHTLIVLFGITMVINIVRNSKLYSTYNPECAGNALLAENLDDNNLRCGYSAFWDASVTTVYSKNQTKVRAIQIENNKAANKYWFCKSDWFYEPANFVVISENGFDNITKENVISVFGLPSKTLLSGSKTIYIYDYDISSKIQVTNSSEGKK